MLKRIVILGPESTGKSTLCGQLAAHYNCLWVPEFAREYLLAHGPGYTTTDLLTIAQKQLAAEENTATRSAALNKEFLFIDTDTVSYTHLDVYKRQRKYTPMVLR